MERREMRSSQTDPSYWHLLPQDLLSIIFARLSDKDRCQARLVCKAWDVVFRLPYLWRRHAFIFQGCDSKEAIRACMFMESGLGAHLHHLTLHIGMPIVNSARAISLAVEQFLKTKPRGSRLKSFKCTGLEYFQTPLYRIARHRNRMVRGICNFLRRQKWLEFVDLACSQMGREDGIRVLKAITYHGRMSKRKYDSVLAHLELRDFFLQEADIVRFPNYLESMGGFSSLTQLKHLCLNATYLSDEVLSRLVQKTSSLEVLVLYVEVSHFSFETGGYSIPMITDSGWSDVVNVRPRLRVALDMRGRFKLDDFQRVLLPNMPLVELNITSVISSMFFGVEDFLLQVAGLMTVIGQNYSKYLTSFHFLWNDVSAIWAYNAELVRLVRQCKLLRYLTLGLRLNVSTVVDLSSVVEDNLKGEKSKPYFASFYSDSCTLLDHVGV